MGKIKKNKKTYSEPEIVVLDDEDIQELPEKDITLLPGLNVKDFEKSISVNSNTSSEAAVAVNAVPSIIQPVPLVASVTVSKSPVPSRSAIAPVEDNTMIDLATTSINRRKRLHKVLESDNPSFQFRSTAEVLPKPVVKAKLSASAIAQQENPNTEFIQRVAFLRGCVNYMLQSAGKDRMDFEYGTVSIQELVAIHDSAADKKKSSQELEEIVLSD